jgi:hypothetical protein
MSEDAPKIEAARSARERIQRRQRRSANVPEKIQAVRDAQLRRYERMRESLRRLGKLAAVRCTMLLHRVVLSVAFTPRNVFLEEWLQRIPGVRLGKPTALWNQTYSFTRKISGLSFLSGGWVEYAPTNGWTAQFRITLVPKSGFSRGDLETILSRLPNFKLLKLEVALDFPLKSEVDGAYVGMTAIFGKSQAGSVGSNPMYSSWGTRVGRKFIRSYARPETNVYRVELELHSQFLRAHKITGSYDFPQLVELLVKRHIAFLRLDQAKLARRLARLGLSQKRQRNVLGQVSDKEENLGAVLRYLRRRVRLTNVRRLCVPDQIDPVVKRAARRWIREWRRD